MITVKKYGNRRLYDSNSSRYINLEDLAALIRSGESIQVVDARTNEDLTRSVLLQVIMETQGGFSGFPTGFLHRVIRYGGSESPLSKVFMQQVSMGLEMLDIQISQFEGKFRPTPAPPPHPQATTPEPEPPDDEEGAPRPQPSSELTALRDRLAALEKRLGGKK